MSRDAIQLRIDLPDLAAPQPLPGGYRLRALTRDDTQALADLVVPAFKGTPDETPPEAEVRELKRTLEGEVGPFDTDTSFGAFDSGDTLASATVITHFRGRPLLAYAMTHPAHRGRGIGAVLICASGAALADHGQDEMVLAVTRGNPALRLYKRLGFEEWDPPRAPATT